jgi:hypothetical protein
MQSLGTLEDILARVEDRVCEMLPDMEPTERYMRALDVVHTFLLKDPNIRIIGQTEKGDPVYGRSAPTIYLIVEKDR